MPKIIVCDGNKFTRFYIKNLFTNELEGCTEREFDTIVTKHRELYEMEYDGPNAQVFKIDGVVEARRERFENAPGFDEKLYYVEIKETLSRMIPVKALSEKEASEIIEKKYDRGEIVLDASDHIDTEFKTIDIVTVKSKNQEGVKSKDDGREIE